MNVSEANLLLGSLDDLSRTLMANKLEKRRGEEAQQRIGLAGQEMDLRREDQTLDRQQRTDANANMAKYHDATLAGREKDAAALAKYRDSMTAAKSDEDKFKIFTDMVKAGAVTPQSLDAMSKAMSQKLGVEVQLKLPDKQAFDTREGHNLALAEKYRDRANAARRNGGGDEAERFLSIADRLERGGQPEPEETAELTEEMGAIDPLSGKGEATLRRKLRGADIESALKGFGGGRAGAGAPAATGAGGAPAAEPQFNSEAEARAAGHKAGDIVRLMLDGKPTRVRLK